MIAIRNLCMPASPARNSDDVANLLSCFYLFYGRLYIFLKICLFVCLDLFLPPPLYLFSLFLRAASTMNCSTRGIFISCTLYPSLPKYWFIWTKSGIITTSPVARWCNRWLRSLLKAEGYWFESRHVRLFFQLVKRKTLCARKQNPIKIDK